MNDLEFRAVFDRTLLQLEEQIDAADWPLDGEREAETLQLCFKDGIKWVITPQPPLKQLWFATHQQGYHFDFKNNEWIDHRSGEKFVDLINRLLSSKLKVNAMLALEIISP